MRTPGFVFAAALAVPLASAHAQSATPEAAPIETDTAAELAAEPPATPATPAPAAAPVPREWERPVLVAAYAASDRVPAEVVTQVAQAVAAQLAPAARRRETRVVDDAELLGRLAVCPVSAPPADAPVAEGAAVPVTPEACVGPLVAEAHGEVAVVARVDRARPRRAPYDVTVRVHDRETGALRGEPVVAQLPQNADAAEALGPALAPLAAAMPPPPPRQYLTVATNVDGAEVRVGDRSLGSTPVAPVELAPGRHVVTVAKDGFGAQNRVVQMRPGQDVRINVDFTSEADENVRYDWETGELVKEDETPWYLRWYTITAAAAVVVGAVIVGVVVASSGDDEVPNPVGVPIPPIQGGN